MRWFRWFVYILNSQRNDRCFEKNVKTFFSKNSLPFNLKAPPYYIVGHEPTIRCNLKCKMCYQGQTREYRTKELDKNELIMISENLISKVKNIKLVGGEPLVKKETLDLIKFWKKRNINVSLQTNATLINERNILKFRSLENITSIITSLDGPKEIHDTIRGKSGSFDRLEKAIIMLKNDRPDIHITIFSTLLVEDNLDKLNELIDTVKSFNIDEVNILFEQVYDPKDIESTHNIFQKKLLWKRGEYRINTNIRDTPFSKKLDSRKLKNKLRLSKMYGLLKGCLVNYRPYNYYKNMGKYLGNEPSQAFCVKLIEPTLRINQEGNIIWCDVIEKSFGSLLEKSPDEIWLSEDYQVFRKYLFKNSLPICRRCCKAYYL